MSGVTKSADVVGVFDSNFNQLFANARPMKVAVTERAKVLTHPLENGTETADHIVFAPVEIVLPLICVENDYKDVYSQIRALFYNATTVTVATMADMFTNMLISEMPHEETPDLNDTISINLTLVQILVVSATSTSQVPATMTTKNNGNSNATAATTTQAAQATATTQKSSALYSMIYGK